MKKSPRKIAILLTSVALIGCGGAGKDAESLTAEGSGVSLADIGLDPTAIDTTVNPCDDFYQYACGGWLAQNTIPADRSSFGRFHEISDANEAELRSILTELSANTDGQSREMNAVRDYYGACMDEPAAEATGIAPLVPLFATIDAITDGPSLQQALIELHRHRVWALFSIEAEADFKDATTTILWIDQAGLGLPDRDYYLKDDKKQLQADYRAHIGRMLELSGLNLPEGKKAKADTLAAAADAVYAVEASLAANSKSAQERRNPAGLYNPIDRKKLSELVPTINWTTYFTALGFPAIDAMSVSAPNFFKHMSTTLAEVKPEHWRMYLRWHLIQYAAPKLTKAHVDEAFKLTTLLTGQKVLRPRWKRCLAATNGAVGEWLAQPFVDRKFGGASKKAAEDLVLGISKAFAVSLESIDWMSDQTRQRAEEKRAAMSYLIGYPDKWKNYDYPISPKNYLANSLAFQKWELGRVLAKVGKPFDRSEWYMVPQRVNAYYNPLANQMVYPAGILQPPFFSVKASDAVNLGAMGMIVGHELTHGFDDSGAQFDKDGNMKNWWQKDDLTTFKGRGECVVNQYSNYEALPGKHVNGKLTLGENIADIGGVKLAFAAYRTRRAGKTPIVANGYTEDQQFYLAVGQAWCGKYRDAVLEQRLLTDPHSPGRFRVNGALSNQRDFATAFSCEKGTSMNPKNSCEVW